MQLRMSTPSSAIFRATAWHMVIIDPGDDDGVHLDRDPPGLEAGDGLQLPCQQDFRGLEAPIDHLAVPHPAIDLGRRSPGPPR